MHAPAKPAGAVMLFDDLFDEIARLAPAGWGVTVGCAGSDVFFAARHGCCSFVSRLSVPFSAHECTRSSGGKVIFAGASGIIIRRAVVKRLAIGNERLNGETSPLNTRSLFPSLFTERGQ